MTVHPEKQGKAADTMGNALKNPNYALPLKIYMVQWIALVIKTMGATNGI